MFDLFFKPYEFIANLRYMGIGMLGIFLVIGFIIAIIYIFNKALKPKN